MLVALGVVPAGEALFGCEGAGVVLEVGPGVDTLVSSSAGPGPVGVAAGRSGQTDRVLGLHGLPVGAAWGPR
ncbi:hypothetical protein [Streptomyces pratensis]|uniref:hypothetical protein n=1 Tax=Streptomyces pratensis TaxID=1169025 RepID=UPI003B75BA49